MDNMIRYLAERPTLAKAIVIGVGSVIGIAIIVLLATVRETRGFRRRGYRVRMQRDGGYLYEEAVAATSDEPHLLPFRTAEGTTAPVIPAEAQWDSQVPAWARGRRDEIAARIGSCLKGFTSGN